MRPQSSSWIALRSHHPNQRALKKIQGKGSAVLSISGMPEEVRMEEVRMEKPDLVTVTPIVAQIYENKQMTLTRSTKFLLEAIEKMGLAGLPSVLTAVPTLGLPLSRLQVLSQTTSRRWALVFYGC